MAAIFQMLPDGSRKKFVLQKDNTVIGRSTEADVVLQDSETSRQHCQIVREGTRFFLHDLSSKNGTFLNGKKISKTELQDDYRIRVGSTLLTFRLDIGKGAATMIGELEGEVKKGKGYHTLLGELVKDIDRKKPR